MFQTILDLVVTLLQSRRFLIGLAFGTIAGFAVWWLMSGSSLRGVGSAVTWVSMTLAAGILLEGRNRP